MNNTYLKLDILAFGAHPDDVEACAGGMLAKSIRQGLKAGIIDLTAGDNSETADGKTRIKESLKSAKVLGVHLRKNLSWPDGNISGEEKEIELVKIIRQLKPEIAVIPYWEDRHKSHRDASFILERAIQTAKYSKIMPDLPPHKVKIVLYYMLHYEFSPTFIFDISDTQELKMKALKCHKSQLFIKSKSGKFTNRYIDPDFMEAWIARSRWYGYIAGVKYGEPYAMRRPVGLKSLNSLTNLYR